MKNILKIFSYDVRSLKANVVSVILIIGLAIMPSIFAWYNTLASWDVFNNTSHLKVAVVNNDSGYKGDLLQSEINIGEQVVGALRGNNDFEWVFTDKDDAIDGTAGGRYYAALVIPESFSQDMMTFFKKDTERVPIKYYSNEKKSAIAPKLTDQGADKISYTINETFAETISELALNLVYDIISLSDDNENLSVVLNNLLSGLDESAKDLKVHVSTLNSYSDLVKSSRELVASTKGTLETTKNSLDDVSDSISGSDSDITSLIDALNATTASLQTAIDGSVTSYENTAKTIDDAFLSGSQTSSDVCASLRAKAYDINESASKLNNIIASLEQLKNSVPSQFQLVIEQFISLLNSNVTIQNDLVSSLNTAADNIENSSANVQSQRETIKSQVNSAIASIKEVQNNYDESLKPRLEELSQSVSQVVEKLRSNTEKLNSVEDSLTSSLGDADSKIGSIDETITSAAEKLNQASQELTSLHSRLSDAMSSGGVEKVKELIADDPTLLAQNLSAPITIERHSEFSSMNFGSSMSPLYSMLGLWVGALLAVVLMKTNPSRKEIEQLDKRPHMHEQFLGRFGVFAIVSLMQSTMLAFGNMFFLGVQVNEPVLYFFVYWVSGLVFQFIMYTLVASFGNVGKAIGVLLLIVQVTGSGGTFPLQLLPDYSSFIHPLLPASYVIDAIRSAMFGIYEGDLFVSLGKLLLFTIPFLIIGLLLRRPFVRLNEKFVAKLERSKLV